MAVDVLALVEKKLAVAEVDQLDVVGQVDQHVLGLEVLVAEPDLVVHWS